MQDRQLRSKLIRLAHAKPELRPHLLPLLHGKKGAEVLDSPGHALYDAAHKLVDQDNDAERLFKNLRKAVEKTIAEAKKDDYATSEDIQDGIKVLKQLQKIEDSFWKWWGEGAGGGPLTMTKWYDDMLD